MIPLMSYISLDYFLKISTISLLLKADFSINSY